MRIPKLCADCGESPRNGHLTRGRCERCYQRHVTVLKREGTFTPLTPPAPLADRLFGRVAAGYGGCIIWTGALTANGYGTIGASRTGKTLSTHRVAYELRIGPIPEGMHLDHLCHTRDAACPGGRCIHRRCINPYRLEAVTPQQNTLRSATAPTAVNARKAHCTNGHPLDEANTFVALDGSRTCRACRRAADQRYRARAAGGAR